MKERSYIAIDLKSFYASVECVDRGLDPLTTNLLVADETRTDKTICLAVSPSLKSYGIPGRPRLFEAIQAVKLANDIRIKKAPGRRFTGSSYSSIELANSPSLAIDYIVAPPRMARYIKFSTRIYEVYLKYIAPEDIHVYSIDEVFIDATHYLNTYKLTAHELTMRIIRDVLNHTGITATAGIGTNMYLCKIAMDIVAKHLPADKDGVRIAELDEMSYRQELWSHRPLTDFWRIGGGYSSKLEKYGLQTMGDVARCSIGKPSDFYNEDLLYKLFGINAELLIDHAWGWEPCTMAEIKSYRPQSNSISTGQVLHCPYSFDKARIIVKEMADMLSLDLVEKDVVTDQIVLYIGYDGASLSDPRVRAAYTGRISYDHYGRAHPRHANGTINLDRPMSSTKRIMDAVLELYDRITDPNLLIRRINITAAHVVKESAVQEKRKFEQLNIFEDYEETQRKQAEENEFYERERNMQKALISIKRRFGKNAIVKGMNFEEGATAIERNGQIGGHKA